MDDIKADSEEGEWITRRQAAELARVHINTVRLWEGAGKIQARRAANGLVLLRRSEITEIAERRASDHALMAHDDPSMVALQEMKLLMRQLEEANARYDKLLEAYQRLVDKTIEG